MSRLDDIDQYNAWVTRNIDITTKLIKKKKDRNCAGEVIASMIRVQDALKEERTYISRLMKYVKGEKGTP